MSRGNLKRESAQKFVPADDLDARNFGQEFFGGVNLPSLGRKWPEWFRGGSFWEEAGYLQSSCADFLSYVSRLVGTAGWI